MRTVRTVRPRRFRDEPWVRAMVIAAALAGAILALFVAYPILEGFRFPIGPDGPVYTWWARSAEVAGLGVLPGRPGVPAATLVLGGFLRTEPIQTVALLGPLLAAAAGLAAGALLEMSLGSFPLRSGAAAILTGGFAAGLAPGWLGNLGQVVLFLAALAVFARADRSWRPVWLGGGLVTAGAFAHPAFQILAGVILAGALLTYAPAVARHLKAGGSFLETLPGRVAIGAVAGGAAAGAGFASLAIGATPIVVDTSQDGFFRRVGLAAEVRRNYRERVATDVLRGTGFLTSGIGFGAAVAGRRREFLENSGGRYLLAILASWGLVTAGGMLVLGPSGMGPAHRLLAFAFVLPIAGGVAFGLASGTSRRALLAAAVIAGAVFVGSSLYGWYREEPHVTAAELSAVARAAAQTEGLAGGTPLIFVVDTPELSAAFHVTRFGNVIRMGLPAARIDDLYVATGDPADFLADRPTATGDPEHDELSRVYLEQARPVRDRAAVFVLRPFNIEGYETARRLGTETTPGLVLLKAPSGALEPGSAPTDVTSGLDPIGLMALPVAALALLGALGGGWALWSARSAGPLAVSFLACPVGVGVLVLAGVIADRLGMAVSGPAGVIAAGLVAAAGYVAAHRTRA
ncbi:MAG: hypothetical protein ACRDH6_05950 [Actinomycetota bacterium]